MIRRSRILFACLLMAGCSIDSTARKVTDPSEATTDYQAGKIYLLRQAVALIADSRSQYDHRSFSGYDHSTLAGDQVEADYQKGRVPKAVGLLPPGTRIRFDFLGVTRSLSNAPLLGAYGTIMSGPFAGTKIEMDGLGGPTDARYLLRPRNLIEPE